MVKARVVETVEGIQDEYTVEVYDEMLRRLRDRGWMETDLIIKTGINEGLALELGPGPGYLGLEWLKKTKGTRLKAVEISLEMIKLAEKNAAEYGLSERVQYVEGNVLSLPFEDGTFDGVFSNGSLHEWENAGQVFSEAYRVLKTGGKYCITDMRRDMNPLIRLFLKLTTRPKEIRPGLITSINAAYTSDELTVILAGSKMKGWKVSQNLLGLAITGTKPASG